MALADKVFEAKLYNLKSQIDGLVGMAKRKTLPQSKICDELAFMVVEVSQAVTASEQGPDCGI